MPELPLVRVESVRLTTSRWFYGLRWAFPYVGVAVAGFYGITATALPFFPQVPGLPLVPSILRTTFCAFCVVAFAALVVGGPLLGVAQVHREIRSRRVEILRVTPARPLWIVAQWTLVTTLVPLVVGLACLPGLLVTGAWGGLSLETMAWLFLLTLSALLFAASVGVLSALRLPSLSGAMAATFLILVTAGIALPTLWFGFGGTLLEIARVHPFCAMIASYRHPDLLGGPNGPWPPVLISLGAAGLVMMGAAAGGLPSLDPGSRPRLGSILKANPFDPISWEGTFLYGETLAPWSRFLRSARRKIVPGSWTGGIALLLLLGIPLLLPGAVRIILASFLLPVEMGILIIVSIAAGAAALGKEHTRPTLPLILTAPLETGEILRGCSRGLILAVLPFVLLPVAQAAAFSLTLTISPWAPVVSLAIGLATALLFTHVGMVASAWSQSLQGGMTLGILLGLAVIAVLPLLSPLVAGTAIMVVSVWSVWRVNIRYFDQKAMDVDGLTFSLGCGLLGSILVMTPVAIWVLSGALLMGDRGVFEDIWWANPIALGYWLPHSMQARVIGGESFLRALVLCCASSVAAAWGLGVLLRERFDGWTDRAS